MELISKKMPANYSIVDTGDWYLGPLNCNIDGIIKMHLDAPKEVKKAYNMKIDGNNIIINSKYTIVVGEK